MSALQLRLLGTTATALLLGAALVTPSAARQDAGPAPQQDRAPTSCPLTRVGTQFVRCDDLTGNGVSAPLWVPRR
ncbi:hypothetical protein GCM10023168_03120 [Fodinibacter luteus]|uniref:Uncharacterized protein n=1 Tax=Fodinibacter luteus TaxID=552064 RepID=A0ABP8JXV7_9MICO